MKQLYLLILIFLPASCGSSNPQGKDGGDIHIEKTLYEGRPHFLVRTLAAAYYFDIQGGGFSRIFDWEGNDWINFIMEPWDTYPASAASSYRGLPNLIYQGEDDGAGHPGHNRCTSRAESNKIISESVSGQWLWSWEFHNDYAVLDMIRTDPDRSYWFLYEGTPGGSFSPEESYFGTSEGGPFPCAQDYYKGNMLRGRFRWIYAGNNRAPCTLFFIQKQEDEVPDIISILGNTEAGLDSPDGMTVFGFGRGPDATPLLKGKQCFVIGFYPEQIGDTITHHELGRYIQTSFLE